MSDWYVAGITICSLVAMYLVGFLTCCLFDIRREVKRIMGELEDKLQAIYDKVAKVGAELKQQIADLQAAIGAISPEAQAKIDAINASLQELDDLNPDTPA